MDGRSTFRILALSGGGVRGVFQACFLKHLEDELDTPLHESFDLCVGTSIGSVSAAAISANIPARMALDIYNKSVSQIFSKSTLQVAMSMILRRGPIFNSLPLREATDSLFGNISINDLKTGFACTAGEVSTYNHRIFSSYDESATRRAMRLKDAVMASCSAPIVFAPHKLPDDGPSFLDGGIWANSPTLVGLQIAMRDLGVPLSDIQMISIGTGGAPSGSMHDTLQNIRGATPSAALRVIDMYATSQADYFDETTRKFLTPGNFISINPKLKEEILLYDAKRALLVLPSLAESEFSRCIDRHGKFFGPKKKYIKRQAGRPDPYIGEMIDISGLSRIMPNREYYRKYRSGSGNIAAYLGTAKKSIEMVSISLSTGLTFEQIASVLRRKLEIIDSFFVKISFLNPDEEHLMKTVTSSVSQEHFEQTASEFSENIRTRIAMLKKIRSSWPEGLQRRFDIRVHDALPQGSAIIIDRGEPASVIQIETKPYKAPIDKSFAIEFRPAGEDGLYDRFLTAFSLLLKDGKSVVGMVE